METFPFQVSTDTQELQTVRKLVTEYEEKLKLQVGIHNGEREYTMEDESFEKNDYTCVVIWAYWQNKDLEKVPNPFTGIMEGYHNTRIAAASGYRRRCMDFVGEHLDTITTTNLSLVSNITSAL